jgi:SM-20-related protein
MGFQTEFSAVIDVLIDDIASKGLSIIECALPMPLTERLQAQCEKQQSAFEKASIGRNDSLQKAASIRSDKTKWFDAHSDAEKEYLSLMEVIRHTFNQRFFMGLFDYECHFSIYQSGDFYKKHLDAFRGKSNRVITTIFYLNTPTSGGELLIYGEKDKSPIATIQPKTGTLVCFESERFPHQVLPAEDIRYSIAGWFRVNNSSSSRIDPYK